MDILSRLSVVKGIISKGYLFISKRYLWLYCLMGFIFFQIAVKQPFLVELARIGNAQRYESCLAQGMQATHNLRSIDFRRGINYYRDILAVIPDQDYAYNNMGYCYFHLNNFSKALKSYNRAIRINPNIYTYYWNKGMVFFYLKQYENAIRSFKDSLRVMPLTVKYYKDFIIKINVPLDTKDVLYSYLVAVSREAQENKVVAEFQIARSYFYLKKMDKMSEFLSNNLPFLSEQENPLKRQKMLENFVSVVEQKYQQQLDVRKNLCFDLLFGPHIAKTMLFSKLAAEEAGKK